MNKNLLDILDDAGKYISKKKFRKVLSLSLRKAYLKLIGELQKEKEVNQSLFDQGMSAASAKYLYGRIKGLLNQKNEELELWESDHYSVVKNSIEGRVTKESLKLEMLKRDEYRKLRKEKMLIEELLEIASAIFEGFVSTGYSYQEISKRERENYEG